MLSKVRVRMEEWVTSIKKIYNTINPTITVVHPVHEITTMVLEVDWASTRIHYYGAAELDNAPHVFEFFRQVQIQHQINERISDHDLSLNHALL